MPTARKLKSGSWNCRVFSHYEYLPDGKKKRIYESFTCNDPSKQGKRKCERMAAEWADSRKDRGQDITVSEAIRKYIDMKKHVLSPATIRGYECYYRKCYADIKSYSVRSLNQSIVQAWINQFSAQGNSAKYVKNAYGLLTAAVSFAGGDNFNVTLPAVPDPRTHTPCDAEVKQLLDFIQDKYELRVAVMLAAFGSMRRGEICALTYDDLDGNAVTVHRSMVRDEEDYWVTKDTPKTDTSNRTVVLPDFVVSQIDPSRTGRIVPITPEQLSNRFRRAVRSAGVQKFRFHDLRHYYVSIAHSIGVPDAYILETAGFKTDHVMKKVYRDTLSDVMAKERDKLNGHFRDAFCDA